MGVSVTCHNSVESFPYSYLQKFRYDLIVAAIKFLKINKFSTINIMSGGNVNSKKNISFEEYHKNMNDMREKKYKVTTVVYNRINNIKDPKKKLIKILELCLNKDIEKEIKYNVVNIFHFDLQELLIPFNLIGLLWFVDHADDNGSFSVGQSLDILTLFKNVSQYLNIEYFTNKKKHFENLLLYKVFYTSVNTNNIVLLQ